LLNQFQYGKIMLRIFLLGVACCALWGCQKKEIKPLARSIYDRSVFAEMALSAAQDDAQFATFKRNPFFNLLWENFSKEEGEIWLKTVQEKYPAMVERMDAFATSDKVGSPRTFSFEGVGEFSPSTLRFVAIAGQMEASLGGLSEEMHVIQIGAGYGGLCKILHDISPCASYTIVDLPEQLALAQRYLDAFGLNEVIYKTPDELPKNTKYDLVISDMSFSEFNRPDQQRLFDRVFAYAKSGFMLGRVFPKHYGVAPMGWEEVKNRFEKRGKFSFWEIEEPTLEKENYLICFRRGL